MPTSREERVRSERAIWLGSKASRRAASHTRSRVSELTSGLSASAREAVDGETPAAAATSARIGRRAAFTPPGYSPLTIPCNCAYCVPTVAIDCTSVVREREERARNERQWHQPPGPRQTRRPRRRGRRVPLGTVRVCPARRDRAGRRRRRHG